MKTAFVTGHMGFIGRHLTTALMDRGYLVSGCDLKDGTDIRNYTFMPADVCFHLAAESNALSTEAYLDATHNIMGTLRVLEPYREKVVFASSAAIHQPVTPYAIAKLACEHYCRLYGAQIVRMCNVTGPGGHGVFEAFAKADTLQIRGKGDQKRAYAPVSRAVELFLYAAENPIHPVFPLEGGELSVLEIADLFYPLKPRKFVEQVATDLPVIR